MRYAGSLLMGLGTFLVAIAFGMDTTVYSSGTYIAGQVVGGGSSHSGFW